MLERLKNKLKRIGRRKSKKDDILSVDEIAEMLHVFPSEVEEACKIFQDQGLVKCWMAEGKIYVVFVGDTKIEDLLNASPKTENDSYMYG